MCSPFCRAVIHVEHLLSSVSRFPTLHIVILEHLRRVLVPASGCPFFPWTPFNLLFYFSFPSLAWDARGSHVGASSPAFAGGSTRWWVGPDQSGVWVFGFPDQEWSQVWGLVQWLTEGPFSRRASAGGSLQQRKPAMTTVSSTNKQIYFVVSREMVVGLSCLVNLDQRR